ncbi:ABC transporter permease [Deinococcus psychrotolerans]|uniref:ABC transporter permease n=1 Tax=Deinococcus psychrotolerans TaxID=2489213 RepID=A0A3G8YDF3_9DEIO|nr:ABC transporter permease [Deinococcus psychrotolerans]AZI42890.1 ABC transporter permease [Deinococcus psychrotolerans]
MTTSTASTARRSSSSLRPFLALARSEVTRLLRNRAYLVPALLLPILFFALWGLSNAGGKLSGVNAGAYMLVSYAAYALISTALFGFGVAVAAERASGWWRQLRVAPVTPAMLFGAKISAALVMGLLSVTALLLFAGIVGHIWLSPGVVVGVLVRLLLGMIPFALLGLALGFLVGPDAAGGVANLISLPMLFASGIFIPLEVAPDFIKTIAPYLPAYHYGQLGWAALGAKPAGAEWIHWAWLIGYGAVFLLIALWAAGRNEARR